MNMMLSIGVSTHSGARVRSRRPFRRWTACVATSGVLLWTFAAMDTRHASAQSAPGTIPVRPSPEIAGVVRGGTQPHVIVTGLKGADDPIWLPGVGLVFSEPNANRIVQLTGADTIATFIDGLRAPLGMTVDRGGRLISLQSEQGHTSIRVVWPRGEETVLAERFEGLPFSRPNGVVSDRSGGVYFTDPGMNPPREAELRKTQSRLPPAVYYVPRGGAPIRVADGIARPNGVQLSRDEKTLYVNDTNGIQSFAFDVLPDGRLARRRVFATYVGRTPPLGASEGVASGADDLAIDNEGRVYAITAAGIEVLTDTGRPVGVIPVTCTPTGARCQALAFGGPDKRTLYVAGNGTLLRIAMVAQGFTGRAK
jgi:gluconolactonase